MLIAEQIGRIPAREQKGWFQCFFYCRLDATKELEWTLLTVMHGHAVLLPAGALVNPAGVCKRSLISQWGPGKATQSRGHQADVAPPAVLGGHVDDSVGVGAAHQSAVLPILTVGGSDVVRGQELTVNPDVSLQVSQTWKHLRPARSEQKCGQ